MQRIVDQVQCGGEEIGQQRGDDDHADHGQRQIAQQHKTALKFLAQTEFIAQNAVECADNGKNHHDDGDCVHFFLRRM